MNTVISDLFFMVDNSAAFAEDLSEEQLEANLRQNAEEFSSLINQLVGDSTVTADEVVDDFKARL